MKDNGQPLTSAVLYVLLALAEGGQHGYAIMQRVRQMSEGNISMGPGTLYGTIKRLLDAGLIVELEASGGRRRTYELSGLGRSELEGEIKRLKGIVALPVVCRLAGAQ